MKERFIEALEAKNINEVVNFEKLPQGFFISDDFAGEVGKTYEKRDRGILHEEGRFGAMRLDSPWGFNGDAWYWVPLRIFRAMQVAEITKTEIPDARRDLTETDKKFIDYTVKNILKIPSTAKGNSADPVAVDQHFMLLESALDADRNKTVEKGLELLFPRLKGYQSQHYSNYIHSIVSKEAVEWRIPSWAKGMYGTPFVPKLGGIWKLYKNRAVHYPKKSFKVVYISDKLSDKEIVYNIKIAAANHFEIQKII